VAVEQFLTDESELNSMISRAEGLCDLVRVKIEDDNDLGLAISVVGDSLDFFEELAKIAATQNKDEYLFMQELRAF